MVQLLVSDIQITNLFAAEYRMPMNPFEKFLCHINELEITPGRYGYEASRLIVCQMSEFFASVCDKHKLICEANKLLAIAQGG